MEVQTKFLWLRKPAALGIGLMDGKFAGLPVYFFLEIGPAAKASKYREGAIEVCNRLGLVPVAIEFFQGKDEAG
jgi:hypothetical protein